MKRKPKSYKAGSRPGSVIKIFCGSMHPTLCGSPNISLTRRSPPPCEREINFSKIWIQRKPKSYKTESRPGSVQYITSPQNILWICVGRQIWAWRAERLNHFEEIGSFTQRHVYKFKPVLLLGVLIAIATFSRVIITAAVEFVQCLGSTLYWYILAIFQSNVHIIVTLWQWTTSLFWKS